jgi:hypothetical protein
MITTNKYVLLKKLNNNNNDVIVMTPHKQGTQTELQRTSPSIWDKAMRHKTMRNRFPPCSTFFFI